MQLIMSPDPDFRFERCEFCGNFFTESMADWSVCAKSREPHIDAFGQMQSYHKTDLTFKMQDFVRFMNKEAKIGWADIFWKLWALTRVFKCIECNERFSGSDLLLCKSHLFPPMFAKQSIYGQYSCCLEKKKRFSLGQEQNKGCQLQMHKVRQRVETDLHEDHFSFNLEDFQQI